MEFVVRNASPGQMLMPASVGLGTLVCFEARKLRNSYRQRAAASDSSQFSVAGSFQAGRGQVGVVSTSQSSPASRPLASSETIKEAQNNAKLFLQGELSRIFASGGISKEKYSSDFKFQDPLIHYSGIDNFSRSLAVLRALFVIDFTVHSTAITSDTVITTRWTMEMTPKLAPWVQKLVFTGKSDYTFDVLSGGKIVSQTDSWDAVQDNKYFSVEGLAHVLRQVSNGQTSPKLESPKYVVWKKAKEYEIRRYSSYLAAEISMPPSAKPASGEGFNDLAAYIFGGNQSRTSMEMTTPVYTTAGQPGSGKMEFPIQERMGSSPESLPIPTDSRVSRSKQEGATVAVGNFGGLPLDFQVTDAERRLRGALLLDGLKPQPGYKLARYNDPFTPPFLRRNEVLIKIDDYQLESAEQ